jgi:hypothetical protein
MYDSDEQAALRGGVETRTSNRSEPCIPKVVQERFAQILALCSYFLPGYTAEIYYYTEMNQLGRGLICKYGDHLYRLVE